MKRFKKTPAIDFEKLRKKRREERDRLDPEASRLRREHVERFIEFAKARKSEATEGE